MESHLGIFSTSINSTSFFTDETPPAKIILLFVYIFCAVAIFPFYFHVYGMNRKRDESTAVFPIISYFYQCLKTLYCYFYLIMLIAGLVFFYRSEKFIWLALLLYSLSFFIIPTICEVNQVIMSLLAAQRFFLYFFPTVEKYLNISKNGFRWLIWILYLLSFLKLIVMFILVFLDSVSIVYMISFFCFNVLIFGSTLMYIPIFLSIRKLSHLSSAKKNRPHRFVLWQVFSLFIVKFVSFYFLAVFQFFLKNYLPIVIYYYFISHKPLADVLIRGTLSDCLLTPILIQVAYLGCNRRNLKTLILSLKPKNFLKTIICPILPSRPVKPERGTMNQIGSTSANRV
ncbi:hypothetical protein CRE_16107 [Caenorhabditis remanei]|uniref:Serpentine Receptor, class Z n=1 Tax=Caenorhabditis remanei TaxID=31234 RepID=E3MBV6_CAERE|nr:hypothetical protein CRE_16107 [Caenorhabditis remanei]